MRSKRDTKSHDVSDEKERDNSNRLDVNRAEGSGVWVVAWFLGRAREAHVISSGTTKLYNQQTPKYLEIIVTVEFKGPSSVTLM